MKKSFIAVLGLLALALAAAFVPAVAAAAHQVVAYIGPENLSMFSLLGTTLAADKARDFELGDVREYGVIASDIIYEGAAVGDNASGYARPLVAGDSFRGFAESKVDNSAGAAGALTVRVKQKGIVKLAIGSLAITDVGKPVYASDDDTFTLTATSNSHIGRVIAFVSTGVGMVEFDAGGGALGALVALTDSSGGTAADTIAAIGASYSQTEVRNAVASLAAKINAIAAMVK